MTDARTENVRVVFIPGGEVRVPPGTPLREAVSSTDVILEQPCGGEGICGSCRVRVTEGAPAPSEIEERWLSPEELRRGWRLGCQVVARQDLAIEVPPTSQAPGKAGFGAPTGPVEDPCFRQETVRVPEATLEAQTSAVERLSHALRRPLRADLPVLRRIPPALAEGPVTVLTEEEEIIAIFRGKRDRPSFGIALDLGTTTVAAACVRLDTGEVRSADADLNRQVRYGSDVISRIGHAMGHSDARDHDPGVGDGPGALRRAALETIEGVVRSASERAGLQPEDLVGMSVVGNPTMMHILLGVDPRGLALAPFSAIWKGPLFVKARELGVGIHPNANVFIIPSIRSNVGADAVAGIIACGLHRSEEVRAFIDLGTNAEVAIGNRERLIACSTAAGPAFEGGNIRQGMRAAPGAIDRVVIQPDGLVFTHVIGDAPARGICGTGIIDAVAELLRSGIVDPSGRLLPRTELPPGVPDPLRSRIEEVGGMVAFRLTDPDNDAPVHVTAEDIRQIQLVKGSIAAGLGILAKEHGIVPEEGIPERIREILIAGAFGNFIRKESARGIGLVPRAFPLERTRFVGNAAGAGARLALVSRDARRAALQVSERAEYVELATREDYAEVFADSLQFPDPGAA